jgi:hypothetical protein
VAGGEFAGIVEDKGFLELIDGWLGRHSLDHLGSGQVMSRVKQTKLVESDGQNQENVRVMQEPLVSAV